jgi:hypothetical protein
MANIISVHISTNKINISCSTMQVVLATIKYIPQVRIFFLITFYKYLRVKTLMAYLFNSNLRHTLLLHYSKTLEC